MLTLCVAVSLICEPALAREAEMQPSQAAAAQSRQYPHRVDVDLVGESFIDDIPATRGANFELNLRVSDRVRVTAREQTQQKFTHGDSRAGGGVAWRATPEFTIRGEALIGMDTTILPRFDTHIAGDYTRGRLQISGESRLVSFGVARAWIVSPFATYWLTNHVGITGSLRESFTTFKGDEDSVAASSFRVGALVRAAARVEVEGAYGHGIDRVDALTLDRLGRFDAQNVMSGARVDLTPLTSTGVRVERQWFENGVRMVRLTASVGRRF